MNKRILKLFMAFMMTLTSFQLAYAKDNVKSKTVLVLSADDSVMIQRVDTDNGNESFRFEICDIREELMWPICKPLTSNIDRGQEGAYDLMFSENLERNIKLEAKNLINEAREQRDEDYEKLKWSGAGWLVVTMLLVPFSFMKQKSRYSLRGKIPSEASQLTRALATSVVAILGFVGFVISYISDQHHYELTVEEIYNETESIEASLENVLKEQNVSLKPETKANIRQAMMRAVETSFKETKAPTVNGTY